VSAGDFHSIQPPDGYELSVPILFDRRGARKVYPGETVQCDPAPRGQPLYVVAVDHAGGWFDVGTERQ
jgi:hypothetical protein